MSVLRLLFSFYGRINRAKYWLGFGIVYAIFALVMTAYFTVLPQEDLYTGIIGTIMIAGVFSLFTIAAKRLHNLDQSGWWVLSAIGILMIGNTPKDDTLRGITSLLLFIAVVALGSIGGTAGANSHGPDPLAGKRGRTPEEESAFEKGRDFSNQLFGVFDTLMRERFDPVRERYLGILRNNVREALQATEGPPLTVARIEYKIFLDQVKDLEPQMLGEIRQYMHEWLSVAHQIGVGVDTENAFAVRVGNFTSDLSMAGLELLTDYAVPLKDADTVWRRANPERAKEFPEPD